MVMSYLETLWSVSESFFARRRLVGSLIIFCTVILTWAALPLSAAATTDNSAPRAKRVLVLHSYHAGQAWTESISAAIRSKLKKAFPDITLYLEYMDTKRHPPSKSFPYLEKLYAHRYAKIQFDLIITIDDNAFNFLLPRRKQLFPGVPVVFCGLNNFKDSRIAGQKLITGVAEDFDLRGTIKLALRLHPAARHIAVISDDTPTGRANLARFRGIAGEFDKDVKFIQLENLSSAELKDSLEKLPDDTLVLLLSLYRSRLGRVFSIKGGIQFITDCRDLPIYTSWDFMIEQGSLGGVATSGKLQGEKAAQMAVKILGGESVDNIPVLRESPNTPMFNYERMKHFGLDESLLPEGSVVVGRPYSFYAQYKTLVWGVAAVIIALALLVVMLTINIAQRRRVEESLRCSEQFSSGTLNDMRTFLAVLKADGEIIFINNTTLDLSGLTLEDVRGKLFHESYWWQYSADAQQTIKQDIEKCAAGQSLLRRIQVQQVNGQLLWIEFSMHPVLDKDGQIKYLIPEGRDITQQMRTEEDLRRSRREWEEIFQAIPQPALILDAEHRIILANRATATLTGLSRKELHGRKCYELFHGTKKPPAACPFEHMLVSGRTEIAEMPVEAFGRTFFVTCTPELDIHEQLQRYIHISTDITDLKQAEEERHKLEAEIQYAQKLESLGVLAGGIAHDFNNFLVGILGNSDLALMEIPRLSPARETVEEIKRAAVRAAELTNQMLAYSGKGKFVVKVINLNELVEEMTHLLEVTIAKNTMLKYNFADNLPGVEADASQMRQIVMNLITNAADAIGDKSGVISVTTGVAEIDRKYLAGTHLDDNLSEGQYAFMEVSDTGCGMDTETVEKIFDPFFTTKFAGRGLGLAAVLGIVRSHHGAIKVYSEPRRGSTFKVLLPCTDKPIKPTETDTDVLDADWRGSGTILIADDDETVRNVTKMMLQRYGFTVLTAQDGQVCVDIYQEHVDEINLVMLDMTMPHMNGEEAFRRLRQIRPDVRVILTSGYNEQEATNRFAGKALAGFIQKPFSLKTLIQNVRQVIERKNGKS